MLRTYLTALPHTKFVLVEDSVEQQGQTILDFLIKGHLDRVQTKVHYFVFHGSFQRALTRYSGNVVVHDFASDVCGWDKSENKESFESVATRLGTGDVVLVDSLVHAIYQLGLAETYRVFNALKTQTGVQQIVTLLHADLAEGKDNVIRCFEHLCTLSISVEPKFISGNGRVQYTYKKLGGKIIKQIEEYKFDGDNFVTQKIARPDPKRLLQNSVQQINPETLTTFRIGLNENEMESRDGLTLPYMYQALENEAVLSQIHYDYDEEDDFDEEDPDDDLCI